MSAARRAAARPGGHGATQYIGFGTTETGRHHSDLHHLFLEDGHAQRSLQYLPQRLGGVFHLFQAALIIFIMPQIYFLV